MLSLNKHQMLISAFHIHLQSTNLYLNLLHYHMYCFCTAKYEAISPIIGVGKVDILF